MKKIFLSRISFLVSLLFTLTLIFPAGNSISVLAATLPSNHATNSNTISTKNVPTSSTSKSSANSNIDSVSSKKSLVQSSNQTTASGTMLPPGNLAASLPTPNSVNLTWDSVYGATAYNIYEIADGQLNSVGQATSTSYSISNLSEGSHSYVVSTVNKDSESAPCAPVSADIVYPHMEAPATLTNTIKNGNDIILSWAKSSYAEKYNIYTIQEDGQKKLLTSTADPTYTITNVPAGTYKYAVSAVNSAYGESSISPSIKVDVVFPTMSSPANLMYKISNGSNVVLSWTSVPYATSYEIYEIIDGQEVLKSTATSATATLSNVNVGNHKYIVYALSTRFGKSTGSDISTIVAPQTMKAPANLAYTISNNTNITLKWSAATYATSYNIYKVVNGEKVLIDKVTGTTISYNNMPAGDYVYEVHSYSDIFGESPEGSQVSLSLGIAMDAPSNFAYKVNNGNDIVLTWDSVSNATQYKVYIIKNGTKTLQSTITGTTVTYSNMAAGDYSYEIHSYSTSYGESPQGSQISFTLTYPQMQAPENLKEATVNATSFSLTWDSANYATGYKIYQIVNGSKVLKNTTSGTTITFPNISPGDYTYEVHSYSTKFGESTEGNSITFTLSGQEVSAPTNLTYSTSNINDITLKWTAAPYATCYNIYQIVDGQKNLVKMATGTSATFTNMPQGDYNYIVTSVSALLGESSSGAEVAFSISYPNMVSPSNLAYTIKDGNTVVLSWAPADYATSYNVYELLDGQEVLKTTVSTPSAALTNVVAGNHTYFVHSVSSRFGESKDGSQVQLNLDQTIMSAPTNLSYNITNGNDITLKWKASNYATSYNIYQFVNGQKTLVKTVTGTLVTFTNMPAGDYDYIVTSVSTSFGESPSGSEISFNLEQPVMTAPTNLAYSIANGNDIILKWTASNYATSYNIYQFVNGQKTLAKTVTGTSITFVNMPAGDYDYVVTSASTRFGESKDGSEISLNLVHPIMIAPTNLAYSIPNGNDITLKWTASSYATSYNIYQIVNGQKSLIKTITGTSFSFTNMPAGDYSYIVTSVSTRFGESADGSNVSFTLTWPIVQAPVLKDTITNVNNINLSWQAVTWANKYRVYEIVGDTKNLLYEGTGLSYQLYNVSENTHNYEVTAYSTRFGESVPSNRIMEKIVYPPLLAPVASLKLLDKTSALISWNFVAYANAYNIYEIVNGNPVLLVKNVNNLSYKLTNLSYKDHQYYVTSVSNSFGESKNSNIIIAKLIIDTEAPTTICDAPDNWTNKTPLVVNLSSSDNITGVDKTYYSINDNNFVEGNSILIDKVGINKISFYSVDKVGNKELTKTAYVKIDKTAPVTTSNVSEGWSKNDTTVNLTSTDAESGVAKTFYSIDGSDYIEGTSFTVTEEGKHKISFYSVDKAGNFETAKTVELNEDKTAPVTTSNISDGWSKDDTTVNLTATDSGSGVAKTFYSIDGANYVEGNSFTITEEGKHTISFYSVDVAGNVEEPKTIGFNKDKTAPVTTSNVSDDWSKADTTVNLTATDSGSGVAKTFYSIDGADYLEGTSFTITEEGNHKISFYSVDAAGNTEDAKTVELNEDKTAPVTTSNISDGWSKEDTTVNLTATDCGSGVAKTFYSIDDSEYVEGTSFTVTEEGKHKISFYSIDVAGNTEDAKTSELNQDKTAPVTTSNVSEGWSKNDTTVDLTATDSGSGVAKTFYSIDGTDYLEGNSFTITDEGKHKISFYSVDAAGNTEDAKTVELNQDKTAPITTSNVPEGWAKDDTTVNLTATDSGSGVAKTFYSIDGANYVEGTSFTITEEGNHKISFYSVDVAGNTEDAKTVELNQDKTAPVTTSNISDSWSQDDTTIKLTATDSGSGVAKTFYSIDGSDYLEGTSFTIAEKGNHKISFYSVDVAGNTEEVKTVELNQDNTAPVTTSNISDGWSKDSTTVNLTATDSGSGIAKTFYSIDGANYVEGTSFTITEEGNHKISFYSVDIAGNTEDAKTAYAKIDKTAPVTNSNLSTGYNNQSTGCNIFAAYNNILREFANIFTGCPYAFPVCNKDSILVNLTAVDSGSGVAKTFYSIDGANYVEGTSFSIKEAGSHKITFYSVDKAGNVEKVKTAEFNKDKTAPVTTSNVNGGWYKNDVNVNLTAIDSESGIAKTLYSIDDAEYLKGNSFTITKEGIHKITFYSVDKAGNTENLKTAYVKIDKTAPVTTSKISTGYNNQSTGCNIFAAYNNIFREFTNIFIGCPNIFPECNKNSSILVNLTAVDSGSGVAKTFYSIDGSTYLEGTSFSIKGEGNHKIAFYSVDEAGNIEESKVAYVATDKTAPVTTTNLTCGWYKDNVTVNLTAVDTGVGVEKTFYSIDDSDYLEGTSFTITEEGNHKIKFYSVDKAGNIENLKTAYVKIDKTVPVTTSNVSKDCSNLYTGCNNIFEGCIGIFTGCNNIFKGCTNIFPRCNKDSVLVSLTASDSGSGVSKTLYSIDDSSYLEGTSFSIKGEGNHKISFYSVDQAGNVEKVKTAYVNIDKTAPVTTSNIQEGWFKDDVAVNLTATDATSDVSKTFYSIDDSNYLKGTSFTVKGEGVHKITFYSVDAVGNVETPNTAYVKIDKTAPTIEMNLANEYKVGSALSPYKSSDNLSGVASEKMFILKPNETTGKVISNGTSFIFDKPGIYTVNITITDYAGITTTIEKKISVVDLPAISDKDIQVLSKDDNQKIQFNNTLYPRIKIRNVSNKEINLSDMQIKYFFTNEGNGESIFECDWAGLNCSSITGSVNGNFSRDNFGNTTLTISLKSDKKLKPGEDLEIQGRIHDPNWKIYNRLNDYSLNTECYSKNDRISIYYKNNKVCGTEPKLDTKDDTQITSSDFTLLSQDANQQAQYNNTLYPRIKIKNISNKQIKLSDMKITYFFTSDGAGQNIFACDNLSINNKGLTSNVKGDFTLDASGNTALNLSFNNNGKILMPGDEIEIQGRIYNLNWKLYNRFNDYSLNTKEYSSNDKICLYVKGINVHGMEP